MGRFLTEHAHFPRAPRLAGTIEVRPATGDPAVVAILQGFMPHQMDGWTQTLGELERYYEAAVAWDVGQAQVDRPVELTGAQPPEAARGTVGSALVSAALAATRGNQIKAAELLGVNRNTLRKKLRDLDIQIIRGGR